LSGADYGYLKAGSGGTPIQANTGYILVRNKTALYSEKSADDADSVVAGPLGSSDGSGWYLIRKESVAEIERKFIIANVNTPDDTETITSGNPARTLYVRVPGTDTSFEIAAAETANFIYTHAGWIMTNSY
jgi:hypothetical protein